MIAIRPKERLGKNFPANELKIVTKATLQNLAKSRGLELWKDLPIEIEAVGYEAVELWKEQLAQTGGTGPQKESNS